jgi:hypothetical protein
MLYSLSKKKKRTNPKIKEGEQIEKEFLKLSNERGLPSNWYSSNKR